MSHMSGQNFTKFNNFQFGNIGGKWNGRKDGKILGWEKFKILLKEKD